MINGEGYGVSQLREELGVGCHNGACITALLYLSSSGR
jgi:hypothetical protein